MDSICKKQKYTYNYASYSYNYKQSQKICEQEIAFVTTWSVVIIKNMLFITYTLLFIN